MLVGYSAGDLPCLLETFSFASLAVLYKPGINPCVDVPEEISRALGGRGYIPVIANAQGLVVRTTLVPAGNSRKQLGIDARSLVGITLRRDEKTK